MDNHSKTLAKPFVKWVGGKTRLLDEVKALMPHSLESMTGITYVEPFVGGGAVLFWILQEFPNIEHAAINDANAKLICTYKAVRDNADELVERLKAIQSEYLSLGSAERDAYYLEQRAKFNSGGASGCETAALFIFLNKTCFNGLYRVNSKGCFNVPHGKYASPKICDEGTLRADSSILQKVEISCGDFSETGKFAGPGTLFYFDPPYKPLTDAGAFTSYTENGFGDSEQLRLGKFIESIATSGSTFIASNSDPKNTGAGDGFFDKLYCKFSIKRVSAPRMVSSSPSGRGRVSEIMVSNTAGK